MSSSFNHNFYRGQTCPLWTSFNENMWQFYFAETNIRKPESNPIKTIDLKYIPSAQHGDNATLDSLGNEISFARKIMTNMASNESIKVRETTVRSAFEKRKDGDAVKANISNEPNDDATHEFDDLHSKRKAMFDLYGISNISLNDLLPMKHHFPELFYNNSMASTERAFDEVGKNKTKPRKLRFRVLNRVKGNLKSNNTQNLFKYLKSRKSSKNIGNSTSNRVDLSKTKDKLKNIFEIKNITDPNSKTRNILSKINTNLLHRSPKPKSSTQKPNYSNFLKSFMEKRNLMSRNSNVKSMDVQTKSKGSKQYTCRHSNLDTSNVDNIGGEFLEPNRDINIDKKGDEQINQTNPHDRSPIESQVPTKPNEKYQTIDTEPDMEFTIYSPGHIAHPNIHLNQNVINTLLDFIQNESHIQTYNEMKLKANRTLLAEQVEKLEEDIARNHPANGDTRKIVKRQITSSGMLKD